MKKKEEITREEFEAMKRHHKLLEYTNSDSIELVNLVRDYVNKFAPSCLSCHSNLRDTKNALNTFYLSIKDETELRFNQEIESEDVISEQPKIKPKKK